MNIELLHIVSLDLYNMNITGKSKNIIDHLNLTENFPETVIVKMCPRFYVTTFFTLIRILRITLDGYNFVRSAKKWEEGGKRLTSKSNCLFRTKGDVHFISRSHHVFVRVQSSSDDDDDDNDDVQLNERLLLDCTVAVSLANPKCDT